MRLRLLLPLFALNSLSLQLHTHSTPALFGFDSRYFSLILILVHSLTHTHALVSTRCFSRSHIHICSVNPLIYFLTQVTLFEYSLTHTSNLAMFVALLHTLEMARCFWKAQPAIKALRSPGSVTVKQVHS